MTPATVSVQSEKPPIPTLWLDTWVMIKLAQLRNGENLHAIDAQRLKRLEELVIPLVKEGKLLCPEGDHEDEYEGECDEEQIEREWKRFSLGARLEPRAGIEDSQVALAMKHYCAKDGEIKIPYGSHFMGDPLEAIETTRKSGFGVNVRLPHVPEFLTRKKTTKIQLRVQFENIRQENVRDGLTYEEKLGEELQGHASAFHKFLALYDERRRRGPLDFYATMEIAGTLKYLKLWEQLEGKPPGRDGFLEFCRSGHFISMPIFKITSQLLAKIVTSQTAIESGDAMDVNLLAVAIPVSHYV